MAKIIIISNHRWNKIFLVIAVLIVSSFTVLGQTSGFCNDRDTVIISNFQEFLVDTAVFNVTVYGEQIDPALAFDGTNYLVMWTDNRRYNPVHDTRGVYGSLVSATGIVTGGSSFAVILDTNTLPYIPWDQYWPSISYDGNKYMLSWHSNLYYRGHSIFYSRVNCSGNLLDTPICLIWEGGETGYAGDPKVIFGENKYLVTYMVGGMWGSFIEGCSIDTSGIADTSFIQITPISFLSQCDKPEIGFGEINYLVVWEVVGWWGHPHNCKISGARVSPSGVLIDTNAFRIAEDPENPRSPSIAFDGTNYLVVWEQGTEYSIHGRDIYGTRISQSGTILDQNPIAISIGQYDKSNPSIIYDGNNYIVVWQDYRSGSGYDIYGTMVSKNGEVENSFPVSINLGDQVTPALTKGPGNQILVVYSGWTGTYNGITYNSMRIWGAKMDIVVGVEINKSNIVKNYSLKQNYPNPFNPVTAIKYQIPKQGFVTVKVYDVLGKELTTLVNEKQNAGSYEVKWDASNYTSGVYFYRLTADDYNAAKKMILIK